jgi:nucleoid DNA-binding protein
MATVQKSVKKVKVKYPDKCSNSAVIKYFSDNNGITKKQAKELIEDLFNVIKNGILNGERVNVGTFGKMFIRVRPATKERKGRNPLTGQEITIPPKKATKVPKFSFSKAFKETAKNAKVKS